MPTITKPLTPTTIGNLKPRKNRYPKSDGGCTGLFIEVMPSGSKIWRYRYTLHGKRQAPVTIGSYPEITIEAARERGRKYAALVAQGISPVTEAKKDRGAALSLDSVKVFGQHWFDHSKWVTSHYRQAAVLMMSAMGGTIPYAPT